ncbi:MAG TPA: hypothetical protein DCX89_01190, partial [Saprospirales bacterium]|nr:hypothetical protein [Saprospirales bacterium]
RPGIKKKIRIIADLCFPRLMIAFFGWRIFNKFICFWIEFMVDFKFPRCCFRRSFSKIVFGAGKS